MPSSLSDTTTSKTWPRRKACRDPVTPVTQRRRQLTRGAGELPTSADTPATVRVSHLHRAEHLTQNRQEARLLKPRDQFVDESASLTDLVTCRGSVTDSMATLLDSIGDLNKSVLSSDNKAVYGMVDKSCHNHSGLLLCVARKREENASMLMLL
ncbi:hypothetical protein F2P81_001787 [Scophthalmus maximus]|uniref:Uncharacterized protein n=1 Tax=Scophthalmus maximus TaxID=52904 RepID=A0A6A4TLD2_SCOMX|nr:hypothetical protein F2P81_001787 [Scophthalmus maximus]